MRLWGHLLVWADDLGCENAKRSLGHASMHGTARVRSCRRPWMVPSISSVLLSVDVSLRTVQPDLLAIVVCVCVSTLFDVGFRVGWGGGGKRLTVASPWCFLLVFFLSHPSFRIWIPRGLVTWFPCFPRSVPGSCLLFLPFPSPRQPVPTGRWERKRGGKPTRGVGERATPHRIAFLPLRGLSVSCSCGARHLSTRTREAVWGGSWCDLGFFGNLSHLGCTSFLRFFGGGPEDRAHTHRRTVSRTPPTSRCRARATSRPLWKVEERHTKRGRKREVATEGEKDR